MHSDDRRFRDCMTVPDTLPHRVENEKNYWLSGKNVRQIIPRLDTEVDTFRGNDIA